MATTEDGTSGKVQALGVMRLLGMLFQPRRQGAGELRSELRQRGLERARAFSWDAAASATLEVYREAAAVGSGPTRGARHA